nr:metallophosphoesterase [uncultured Devosia sp.]
MKIWVLSDLHIDVVTDLDLGEHPDADIIVMAGDLADGDHDPVPWLLANFSDDERAMMVFVPGNHEAYGTGLDTVPALLQRLRDETGIVTLDRETVEFGGRRIVGCTLWSPLSSSLDGLGGDLAAIPDFGGDAWRAAHERDRLWLEETVAEGNIVVTHHAPARDGLDARMQHKPELMRLSSGYYADMGDLIEQRGPSLWIHGHTHVTREYQVAETRVVSNAHGRGIGLHFQPGFVVDVDDAYEAELVNRVKI